jgi:uncharacterized membrane protein
MEERVEGKCEVDSSDKLYSSIRNILITGLFTSIIIIVIGFLMMVFSGRGSEKIMPFSKMAWSIFELEPLAILSLGILILLLTPLARVFTTSIIFYKQKDYLYVAISLFVVVVLMASLLFGVK